MTDTRSGCRCRSGTSQGAPSAGEAAAGWSWWRVTRHDASSSRCVACQVQFIALKVQIKRSANTNVNANVNTYVSMTVNLSQVRTMWHTFNNDSPQWERGSGGKREVAFVSLSTREFIAITLILTYYSQIKY